MKKFVVSIFLLNFAIWIVGGHVPMIRGKSITPSIPFMIDVTKRIDNMPQKKPLAQLLSEFESVHKGRYLYDKVNDENYKNNKSVITVICREHGDFPIIVYNHLIGQGCPECAKIQRRLSNTGKPQKRWKLVYGVGINDYGGCVKINGVHIPSYHTWGQMLKRCYSEEYLLKNATYRGCSVCEEWKHFSNFKKWYDENCVEGYCLDKDILVKGNKLYSPDTCSFVPNEINVLLCKSDAVRGDMPIGVHKRKMVNGYKYVAYLSNNIKPHYHLGTFNTPEEAFQAYKQAKEVHIKEVATQYYNGGKITEKVYNALMNYKVEITD